MFAHHIHIAMRSLYTLLNTALLALLSFGISGCGGDLSAALTDQQEATRILMEGSPWGGPGKVEVLALPEGVDPAGLTGLTLTFLGSGEPDWAPTGFDATGADNYLSAEDATWRWGTAAGTNLITLEGANVAELTSVDVQSDVLTFSYELSTAGNARGQGFDGAYKLALSRN